MTIKELMRKKFLTPSEKRLLHKKLSWRTAKEIGEIIDGLSFAENKPLPEAFIELNHLYRGYKFYYYSLLEEVFTEQNVIFFEGSWVYFATGPTFLSLEAMSDHLVKHMAKKNKEVNQDRSAISARTLQVLAKIQRLFTE